MTHLIPSRPPLSTVIVVTAVTLLAVSVIPATIDAQTPRIEIELEGGAVWVSRNNAEIPNDGSATRFSLNTVTGQGHWPAGRAYVTWNINERHGLRVLLAPLSITERGQLDAPVRFLGEEYAAGTPLEATYTFNSYRLTYRYRFRRTETSTAWVGVTAKVRDATVALEQGAIFKRKDDLGFVPLLHLAGDWRVAPRTHVVADVDALAGGPGRAIDAALKLAYDPGGPWRVNVGYRTVEGGADVDEVYSFAWLHFAVAGVSLRW